MTITIHYTKGIHSGHHLLLNPSQKKIDFYVRKYKRLGYEVTVRESEI